LAACPFVVVPCANHTFYGTATVGRFKTETCLLFRLIASFIKQTVGVDKTAVTAELKEDADQVKNERDESKTKRASLLNEQKAAQKKWNMSITSCERPKDDWCHKTSH
jgi:uncharacterized membrane protein YcgQ (UPF0703/DUF1980 family)